MKIVEMHPVKTIDGVQDFLRHMCDYNHIKEYDMHQTQNVLFLKLKLPLYFIFPFSYFYKRAIEKRLNSMRSEKFINIKIK